MRKRFAEEQITVILRVAGDDGVEARRLKEIFGKRWKRHPHSDRTFEQQRYRASGRSLVTAAIVLWNTVYLERTTQALRERGIDVNDALLQFLSPLGWEHASRPNTGLSMSAPDYTLTL
jgi:hypothetical protein